MKRGNVHSKRALFQRVFGSYPIATPGVPFLLAVAYIQPFLLTGAHIYLR
jgi:hypothetical protein